jgi:hypothetical protein
VSKRRAARIANTPDASSHAGQKSGPGGHAKQAVPPPNPSAKASHRLAVARDLDSHKRRPPHVGLPRARRLCSVC